MNKNFTAIAFIVWVLILFAELMWFFIQTESASVSTLFVITVIVVTLVVGVTWFRLYGSTNED